jgi:DNA-binding transcriptional ArsR family regulator
MTVDRSAGVFAALADPTRRRVIDQLSRRGPSSATELADSLPVTRQAVAKHLAMLEEAGLVSGQRSGRERRYRLTPGPLAEAVSWMASVGSEWDERLEALRRHLGRR